MAASIVASIAALGSRATAQDLGHKIPGAIGLHAGDQPPAGVYFAQRFGYLAANTARDRNGERLPLPGFDFDAATAALGLSITMPLPRDGPYVGATIAVPIGHITLNSDRPEVSIDRYGIGDVFLQPLHLGLRFRHLDVVTGYALYIPTGWYDPQGRQGIGIGHWTQEFSVGGSVYSNDAHTLFLSLLASIDLNGTKRGIDIRRGATAQIQGGVGTRIAGIVDVGIVGYALWQVTDDIGTAVPSALRGARDRVFGAGPEIGVLVAPLNASATFRYTHDFGVLSRPESDLFVAGLTWLVQSLPPAPRASFLGVPAERAPSHGRGGDS